MNDKSVILVVDDNPESLKLLTNILISEGYQVFPADSGKLALASLSVRLPDLILLDIRMPDMDGFEVCRIIKNREDGPGIPVIFISAVTEVEEHVEGFRLGAVDFITKPFQREELMSRVRTHIELGRLRVQLEEQLEMRTEELARLKVAQESLRKTEERLNDAQAMAHAGSFSYNFTSDTLWWSDEVYRLFGIEPVGSPLRYRDVEHMINREDFNYVKSSIQRTIDSGESAAMDYRIIRHDGTIRHQYMLLRAVLNSEGSPLEIVGTVQDITERRQAEDALRNSQAAMLARSESMAHAGSWEWDIEADTMTWSDELFRIFRMNRSGGGPSFTEFLNLYHPEDTGRLRSAVETALTSGTAYEMELRAFRVDGEMLVCMARGYAEMGHDGRPVRLFGSLQDITERKQAEEQLCRANEIAEMAQKASGAGIWDWNIVTGHIEWTSELFNLWGLKPSEYSASFDTWRSVLHSEDREMAEELIKCAVRDRTSLDSRYRIVRPDGQERWINAIGKTIYDETGKPLRMAGFCIDITERKQVEDALQKSEEQFRTLTTLAPIGIYLTTPEGRCKYANPRWCEMAGLTPDEALGDGWIMGLHPEDRDVILSGWQKMVESEDPWGQEYRFRRGDGKVTWVYGLAAPQRDGTGRIVQYVGINIDITERKRTEESLRKSEESYRTILETALDGFWILDMEGHVIDVNEACCKITGYSREELLEKSVHELEVLETGEEVRKHMEKIIEQGSDRFETRHRNKEGQTVDLEVSVNYLSGEGKFFVFLHDITGRKKAEEEKEKLQEQLAQARKMETVGRLAGGVAHNFNNMLGIILGSLELTLDDIEPENPIIVNLETIRSAAERSAKLTRQLLAFASKQTVAPVVLDLNKTVTGMLSMLRQLIGENIDIVWKPFSGLNRVKIDSTQIDQILTNLIINARDAIGGTGTITIETENTVFDEAFCTAHPGFLPGEYVMLSVSDNGCGMNRETLANIFEPFFTTKEPGRGTGLGLATVYGIIRQNNGFIDVCSQVGTGTTFRIYLPRYLTMAGPVSEKRQVETVKRGNETVLLVEDEEIFLELTEAMLKNLGYKVITAVTPVEALRLAGEYGGEIHLLITDVIMPRMNGSDLYRQILSIYPDMKCLFMSGYTDDIIAGHGVLDRGMNFIHKPFSRKELASIVRDVMEQK